MNSRLVYGARIVYLIAAWLFVVGVLVTVFMAGLSLFAGSSWEGHMGLGYTIGYLGLVLIVLAFLARIPRSFVPLLALLLVLYVIQTILPTLRGSVPVVAALHPVNAMLVFGVSVAHALRARELPQQVSRPATAAG